MNSSCSIDVAKDVEISSRIHIKKPPLTKNHQKKELRPNISWKPFCYLLLYLS